MILLGKGRGARRSDPSVLARRASLAHHPAVGAVLRAHQDGSAPLPLSVDYDSLTPGRVDQGDSEACTWASTSIAIATGFAAIGQPLGFVPSQREGWAATRAVERALANLGTQLPELQNVGCQLSTVFDVYARYGVKPTDGGALFDITDANMNVDPDLTGLELAGKKLIVGPYGVDPSDPNLSDTLAAALVAKVMIEGASFVDMPFMQLKAGSVAQPCNEHDPRGGGHAFFFNGYQTVNGQRLFWLANSWSKTWCDNGRVLASPAFMSSMWEVHPLTVSVLGA